MEKLEKSCPKTVGRDSENESTGLLPGGIAHELNNILGVIMGFTQLTLAGIPENAHGKSYLEEAMIACHRAKELVAQIIAYDSEITVESEPGKGTKIHDVLPGVQDSAPFDEFSAQTALEGTERILFVDDEEAVCRMWYMLLEPLGYRVTLKTSSLDALETFQEHPDAFDLVITDLTMPNMTGIELASSLLKIKPGIPIILCSGFSGQITVKEIRSRGIRELLMKPLALESLTKAIRRAAATPGD